MVGRIQPSDDEYLTNCENPVALRGLSLTSGIIFVSNSEEIKDLKGGLICQGNSSKVVARLDMKEGRHCTDINWCSEKETEEECQISCHSLTGNFEKNYMFCFLYIIFSVINLDITSSELEIKLLKKILTIG